MRFFLSNKIESLYRDLKSALFSSQKSHPFARRMIVVPSPAIKSWLMLAMAKDPELGIAFGIEIVYLEQSFDKLTGRSKTPTPLELALAIEVEIANVVRQPADSVWLPIYHYLKVCPDGSPNLSRKSERRLIALSEKLAQLFTRYGLYGGLMVGEWKQRPDQNWQASLWQKVFESRGWTYKEEELRNATFEDCDPSTLQLHLFSISFLPKAQFDFFSRLSEKLAVHYYLLSPCQALWTDICSDRERVRIQAYWKERGISEQQERQLEEYLRDRNPLLANFGKLGREMAKYVEDTNAITKTEYAVTRDICNEPLYEELYYDELEADERSLSLLTAIQADMVLLRNPQPEIIIELPKEDRSIQIHVASSPLRELQILYNNLIHTIAKGNGKIGPGDIIVMAPDIMEYLPYISAVFGHADSKLDYHVMDLHMPAQSHIVQAFLHLLTLPAGRWDSSALMRLMDYSIFQEVHQFTREEVEQIRKWLVESGICWGEDANHRNELLLRDYCQKEMVEASPTGTWDFGLSRLLAGLALKSSSEAEENLALPVLPVESIDATRGALLGKFISLVRSLREDLRPLSDGTRMTLAEWSDYLKCIAKAYLAIENRNTQDSDENILLDSIESFKRAGKKMEEIRFSFATVKKHLEGALKKQKVGYRESHLNAVRFCSMLPMRAIPAQVVALIGMSEESFPRMDNSQSMNLLKDRTDADYCPTQTDFDRYLFLEALLSARSQLLLSYVGYSTGNDKELSPSLVLSELMGYADNGYRVGERKFSEACVIKHPFQPFDKAYFSNDSNFPSYSESFFKLAQAHYKVSKEPKHSFVSEFSIRRKNEQSETLLDITKLDAFVKNPVKSFMNEVLGIYIREEEEIAVDERFELSRLTVDTLKKEALRHPLPHVIKVAERQGRLPIGLFKELAIEDVINGYTTLKNNLSNAGVEPETIYSIQFMEQCRKPEWESEKHLLLPPVRIPYRDQTVTLVGKLLEVSPKGVIAHLEGTKKDITKSWVRYLAFDSAVKEFDLPCDRKLILTKKSGKIKEPWFDDPKEKLNSLLDYYHEGMSNISPLVPEWVHDISKQEGDYIEEKLLAPLEPDSKTPFYNDYLKWALKGANSARVENWQTRAQEIFGEILENWTNEKSQKGKKKGSEALEGES